jgi:hypothetical protein
MIEASYPQTPGQKARLISRPFEPKNNGCRLVFYYHMYGEDMGELNVYTRYFANGPLNKIFGISGRFDTCVFPFKVTYLNTKLF